MTVELLQKHEQRTSQRTVASDSAAHALVEIIPSNFNPQRGSTLEVLDEMRQLVSFSLPSLTSVRNFSFCAAAARQWHTGRVMPSMAEDPGQ